MSAEIVVTQGDLLLKVIQEPLLLIQTILTMMLITIILMHHVSEGSNTARSTTITTIITPIVIGMITIPVTGVRVSIPTGEWVWACPIISVSYTHLRTHETDSYLV